MHLASYRLAPVQDGMLVHHIQDAHSSVDIEQLCALAEVVDADSQGATAIVFRGQRLTCQKLADRLANPIRSEGLWPGDVS